THFMKALDQVERTVSQGVRTGQHIHDAFPGCGDVSLLRARRTEKLVVCDGQEIALVGSLLSHWGHRLESFRGRCSRISRLARSPGWPLTSSRRILSEWWQRVKGNGLYHLVQRGSRLLPRSTVLTIVDELAEAHVHVVDRSPDPNP